MISRANHMAPILPLVGVAVARDCGGRLQYFPGAFVHRPQCWWVVGEKYMKQMIYWLSAKIPYNNV